MANYNIKQKAVKSLLSLEGISCELLEDDLVYINTGDAEGITVKVVGRGRNKG